MKEVLMVGIGGFVGSALRYLTARLVNHNQPFGANHYMATSGGVLTVNLIGCFLIGLLAGFLGQRDWAGPNLQLLLITGLLGGFTTFSTFGLESFQYLQAGEYGRLMANVGLNLILGILLAGLGLHLSKGSL